MFSPVPALDKSDWVRSYTSNPRDCHLFHPDLDALLSVDPRSNSPIKILWKLKHVLILLILLAPYCSESSPKPEAQFTVFPTQIKEKPLRKNS